GGLISRTFDYQTTLRRGHEGTIGERRKRTRRRGAEGFAIDDCLRFVPSRVDGLPDVTEVVVRPDRLELLPAGAWVTVRLADIARCRRRGGFRGLVLGVGRGPGPGSPSGGLVSSVPTPPRRSWWTCRRTSRPST